MSKREPKHIGEVMSDIAERYNKLTKTKMSEKELLELGFTKEFSTDIMNNDAEDDPNFYYYVKEITNGLTFITNGNDEMEGKEWYVEFFDTEIPIRYYESSTVKMLFMLIEEGIVKTK